MGEAVARNVRNVDWKGLAFLHAADAILVIDAQGRILSANLHTATLTGCPQAELLTMTLENLQMNPLPPFPDDAVRWEGTLRTCDGITVPVEISRALLEGEPPGASVLVVRDMSAHMAAIREYERLIADLDDFAHVVAHDLQNPLNNIMHSLDMLVEGPANYPPEVMQKITAVAVRSTHKAMAIIDELLLLAGVRQAGEVPIAPLDMDLLIREVLDRLQYVIEDAEAVVHLPKSWPAAQGYAPWVEEVWANYISNALKYGGAPPVVTLGGEAQADGTVRFWVHDNGRGVPTVDRETLFKPFSRLERVRARGHGLGLSIVQRIVTRLGGETDFWNAPEGGAVFSFTLPAPSRASQDAPR